MASTDKDPDIVLAEVDGGFYLVDGEQYLDQLLSEESGFPVPIGIIRFPNKIAFLRESGPGVTLQTMWQVHPKIVERLRDNAQVIEIVVSA